MITLIKSQLFRQGGLEKYTWQIAADFCCLGSPVTVLTSGQPKSPFSHPLLKIVSLPVEHVFSFLNVLHFDRCCVEYLKTHPTPIVFSLDRNRAQTHIRAGNGVHSAYLHRRSQEEGRSKRFSFAINPLHQAILSLEKKAFEHPDLKMLFTNSEMVKREVLQFYQIDPKKIRVVHNGVEWQAMQSSFDDWEHQKQKAIQQWHLDPHAFQFLFIGHNFQRKGLDQFLHALAPLRNENFQLSIVGKEKHLPRFKTLVQRLGLSKRVFFFGPQDETTRFYQLADCLVIPSLYDPFANVTVEALAMGLFVLSSKNNGGHEILNEKNGSIIESQDDVESFAELLRATLSRAKTAESAASIRQSVKHLDFSKQLRLITQSTLDSN